jgi:predicted dehydrogenase
VGHIERFNPAFRELERRLAGEQIGQIFQIKARRTGPTAMRVSDVGVTLDLATHELDIVCRLVHAPLLQIYAQTARRVCSAHEDLFTALLRFADGTVALLDVNWLTPSKIRELWVTGERGSFVVDYLMQDLTFHENSDAPSCTFDASPAVARVSEGNAIRYAIERVEPLRAQLQAFAAAVRANSDPPVPLRDGFLAVHRAELALCSAATGQAIDLDEETLLGELGGGLPAPSYRGSDPLVAQ